MIPKRRVSLSPHPPSAVAQKLWRDKQSKTLARALSFTATIQLNVNAIWQRTMRR